MADPYRAIIPLLHAHLNQGGAVFFEVGHGQSTAVTGMLQDAGFTSIATTCDLGGIERVVGTASEPLFSLIHLHPEISFMDGRAIARRVDVVLC